MPARRANYSRQLKLRKLIEKRQELNERIRALYQQIRNLDAEIATLRLERRRRA